MRFTLRQLEYFIAAAEAGSITLASERIHISQASISAAVSGLERELDVQLFVRHHAQGLSLTPAGRAMLRQAKRLIEQALGLYGAAAELGSQARGRLSLGCLVTLAPIVLPEIARSFTTAFPESSIHPRIHHQEALLDGLRRAEIDIAITYDLQIPDDVAFTALADLPPHVLVAVTDPLVGRDAVTLEELAPLPMILLDLPLSRQYFLSLFLEQGLTPNILERSGHPEVIRTMVANRYGYSLVNVRPRAPMALDGRRLASVRLAGEHRPMRLGLAMLKELKLPRLVQAFESHCRAFISNAHIPGMTPPSTADG
jgi:DNA-binding transcriptional LysR family regulator